VGVNRTRTTRQSAVLQSYLTFCGIRGRFEETGRLEISAGFVFPTTLLPLAVLQAHCKKKVHASNPSVQGYVDWITDADAPLEGGTYVPVVRLPEDPEEYLGVLKHLEDLSQTTQVFSGNRNAYHYILAELVDNIYQHAHASRAYVMAQRYPKKKLIEASFMDDGMTIPKSLEAGSGAKYPAANAHQAILDALNGKSAKAGGERGYGLRTSVRIANALDGEVLIVSGRGAVVARKPGRVSAYSLPPQYALEGTLVSIRLPYSDKRINFYKFLE
jgi:hypothetical protein